MMKRVSDSESDTVGLESTKRESTIAVKQVQFIYKGSAGRVRKQDSLLYALRHASHVT
jgi:hypothetical protein